MKTRTIRKALAKVQHEIAEILPIHGGKWDKRMRQEALFGETLDRRMDERDEWRIPAQNWLKLAAIGADLSRWNDTKMVYERKAAESQKELSRISRQWQEMTDLARGRAPAKGGIGATTTIVVDWNVPNSTGGTAA